jgi:hypothetical protein
VTPPDQDSSPADQDETVAAPPARRNRPGALTLATATATILGTVIALFAWLFPFGGGGQTPTNGDTKGGVSPAVTAAPGAPPPGATGVDLSSLTPVAGGANIVALPRALQGQPGFERAVVIACASNQVNDQFREVTYSVRGRYHRFDSAVRSYTESADDVRLQIQVFRDGGVAGDQTVSAGTTSTLGGTVDGAGQVRIRVTCELPGSVAILLNPRLTS